MSQDEVKAITKKIEVYLAEEYGVANASFAFSEDIYDARRIFLTITFTNPVCQEFFAKGRDHTKLFNEINKEFHTLFKEERSLHRLTLLNHSTSSRFFNGKVMVNCSNPILSYPVNHITSLLCEDQTEPNH